MPFCFSGTLSGLRHLGLRLEKALLSRPADLFIKRLQSRLPALRAARDSSGRDICCATCGFATFMLELDNGWVVEGCSATALGLWLNQERLQKLPALLDRPLEDLRADLCGSQHLSEK